MWEFFLSADDTSAIGRTCDPPIPIHLFGTDISEAALQKARAGVFGENIAREVDPERLERFFIKRDHGYHISRVIREQCVFSRQNVLKDPPFGRLDMISCRNLLIYLEPAAQKRLVPVFHYALKPDGILMLGGAEGASAFNELFKLVDKKGRIYVRQAAREPVPLPPSEIERRTGGAVKESAAGSRVNLHREFERVLLSHLSMAGVMVDSNMRVVEFHGRTGPFLEPAAGEPSQRELILAELSEKQKLMHIEAQFRHKSERPLDVLMNVTLTEVDGQRQSILKLVVADMTKHRQAEMALSQLSARLMELRDDERKSVSRELHDTIGPLLTGLVANLAAVRTPTSKLGDPARARLAESLELAKRCLREVRTVSYLLYPPLLDEAGLGFALRWYVDGFSQRSNIKTQLAVSPELPDRLPRQLEQGIFRIVQEGLTNVHLHSGSQTAAIDLRRADQKLVLEIRDKGRGFPAESLDGSSPKRRLPGIGITSMRERIKQLGGELEIETGSRGSILRAIVPLLDDEKQSAKSDEDSGRG